MDPELAQKLLDRFFPIFTKPELKARTDTRKFVLTNFKSQPHFRQTYLLFTKIVVLIIEKKGKKPGYHTTKRILT